MINYSSIMEEAQAVVEKFEEQIELYMDNEPENECSAKYDKWSEGNLSCWIGVIIVKHSTTALHFLTIINL